MCLYDTDLSLCLYGVAEAYISMTSRKLMSLWRRDELNKLNRLTVWWSDSWSDDLAIRRSGDPTIRRSDDLDPTIRQSDDLDLTISIRPDDPTSIQWSDDLTLDVAATFCLPLAASLLSRRSARVGTMMTWRVNIDDLTNWRRSASLLAHGEPPPSRLVSLVSCSLSARHSACIPSRFSA